MRMYDVAVSSLAIDAPQKWTDNLLSQHDIPDVTSARRGVARRISHEALVRLALIRQLHVRIGLGVADAVQMADGLLAPDDPGVYRSGHLRVSVDLAGLRLELRDRLSEVLESAPAPRRGRPPVRATT